VTAAYVLDATETGGLLPLSGTEHVTGPESRDDTGEPSAPATPGHGPSDLEPWTFCRIAARALFAPRTYASDITLVNWPMLGHFRGPVFGVPEAAGHLRGARELAWSLPYWMQTEAPRPDGGTGWPGLRLRGDADAVPYPDTVGVGMYRIDLRPTTGGDNYLDAYQDRLATAGVESRWPDISPY
jgi:hypothetical protein